MEQTIEVVLNLPVFNPEEKHLIQSPVGSSAKYYKYQPNVKLFLFSMTIEAKVDFYNEANEIVQADVLINNISLPELIHGKICEINGCLPG